MLDSHLYYNILHCQHFVKTYPYNILTIINVYINIIVIKGVDKHL